MKVLFLDIDGVLNKDRTKEFYNGVIGLDQKLLNLYLPWLTKHPEVKVVLSSTWRKKPEHKAYLSSRGLSWISETPFLPGQSRGAEIKRWLEGNPQVTHFAILDDMGFMYELSTHLVRTSPIRGLEPKRLRRVEKLLEL